MADPDPKRSLKPAQVRAEIESLLKAPLSDTELRAQLEALSVAPAFGGFTWLWGPALYRRNRVLFRPFILNYFATWLVESERKWDPVEWKGEPARRLDEWFREVDAADDAELFKRLYPWKHSTTRWGSLDEKVWKADLLDRFRKAATPAARMKVLEKLDLFGRLDELAALELYQTDAKATSPFLLKHLPNDYGDKRALWRKLFDAARARGDDDFAFRLYRRQVPHRDWDTEVLRLAEQLRDPAELCSELERRHPEGGWGLDLGATFYRLVERRGRDVLPYVQKHLQSVFRSFWGLRDGYTKLVKLAHKREWWDLWSALVRTCSKPEEFNAEVTRLLRGPSSQDAEIKRRLLMLTGIYREWNFGPFALAAVQQLDDPIAVALYSRFPDLLRGPFKMNVSTGWFGVLPKLTEKVIDAGDEPLIDYLASRAVTRAGGPWNWAKDQTDIAERFSRYYEQFRDDDVEFSRRAVAVLSQVPAYSIWNYNALIRTNRLARMFYERSATQYLSHPVGVRDLLESPEIHSQALAFRVLGLDREDARRLAGDNLDLLAATLLRPLHRATRALAFRALENAANDPDKARQVHDRCREALRLPDKKYPKENLIGLIARLLHHWPELRKPEEQPVIYGVAS